MKHEGQGGKRELETYGLLWGHDVSMQDGRTLLAIEMATVDTSARMDKDAVIPSAKSLALKHDIMTSYWPHLKFMGDFHTHPYRSTLNVVAHKLYEYSGTDRKDIEERPDFWRQYGYRVGLVLTIALLKRRSSRLDLRLPDGTLEFTLSNYRFWLKGYVAYSDGEGLCLTADADQQVLLDSPALLGLQGEYTTPG